MEYISAEKIREEFVQFLQKQAHYSKIEATMVASDFPSLAKNYYLDAKYIDTVTIDGAEYECRSAWTNFLESGMLDTSGKTFCFYIFYRIEDVPNNCVNEYEAARKRYSVSDLKHEDFPWYVAW